MDTWMEVRMVEWIDGWFEGWMDDGWLERWLARGVKE